MKTVVLREEVQKRIREIGHADILVGIPSYNNAKTIGHVVRAVQAGLTKYFPEARSVIVNSDGGSTDGTMDVVNTTGIGDFRTILVSNRLEPVYKIATPYYGIAGKGSAFRTIIEIADALDASACAVVDSDLRSITPEWMELLVKPALGDFDFVAPLYSRHKYDGTITNSIVYPLTRALYGKQVRQPIGGDFGFSGRLARFYLSKDVWDSDVARYGIDIWMTTTAIANGFSICQSFLGAKIHDPKDPGTDLSSMLYQVVGATFDLMNSYVDVWKSVSGSEKVFTFGFLHDVGLEPVRVNVRGMIERFTLGVRELADLWGTFLGGEVVSFLQGLTAAGEEDFFLPDDVWAGIIYRFALAAHEDIITKEHLVKSLTPLYMGRTASFFIETRESGASEVEEKIEGLCRTFEAKKTSLLESWDK
ncbi:MAG: glycosyl transferase family 2 [Syntrophorhabdales bacterium]